MESLSGQRGGEWPCRPQNAPFLQHAPSGLLRGSTASCESQGNARFAPGLGARGEALAEDEGRAVCLTESAAASTEETCTAAVLHPRLGAVCSILSQKLEVSKTEGARITYAAMTSPTPQVREQGPGTPDYPASEAIWQRSWRERG